MHQNKLFPYLYRDIEPGELIAVDQPVVKHLDKGKFFQEIERF